MFDDLQGLKVCEVDYKGVCNPSPPGGSWGHRGGGERKGGDDLKPVFYSKH